MNQDDYFFCGIGGSGMLPLAMIVQAQGGRIEGSDRSRDQGRTPEKFAWLEAHGVTLHPQDGSGVTRTSQIVVATGAIEDTVPDIGAAKRAGARIVTRPELLSQLFNAAPTSIGVAGTSGKSTITGMIAWILHRAGREPTVMNGAVMKNFADADHPFASALIGGPDLFVSEVDESDGSIARYDPTVAVVSNISLDHKSMEELRDLFGGFTARSATAVLNLDNPETAADAGVTVIDDFAHNPDKIAATLKTLHAFEGRLLILFQPHGFGPLRLMKDEFINGFTGLLRPDDVLLMPEPVYYGGTTDRSIGSEDIASGIRAAGRHAEALPTREACGDRLIALAQPGDRIVVMGARDDTLSTFAADLLGRLG